MSKFPVTETTNGAVEALITTMDADTGAMVTALQLINDAVATTGSAITTKGLAAAGTDGTNARILKLDSDGHVQTDVLSSALPSGASTEATQADVKTAVQLIDDGIATIGAAVPAKGMAAAGSDGTNARLLRTDSDGHVQVDVLSGGGTVGGALEATQTDVKTAVQLIDDAISTTGSAVPAKGMQATLSDGTNARAIRGNTSGYLQPVPKYTDSIATNLTAAQANTAPVDGTSGVAFSADCLHAYVEIYAADEEVGVSNVDVQVQVYDPNSATWNILAGGSLVDLQLETNNRWGVMIPYARLVGTRMFVSITNYVAGATTIKVTAKMTEVTFA